jgi:hypothetical protein
VFKAAPSWMLRSACCVNQAWTARARGTVGADADRGRGTTTSGRVGGGIRDQFDSSHDDNAWGNF